MKKSTRLIAIAVCCALLASGFFLFFYPRDPIAVAQKQCDKNSLESCDKLGDMAPSSGGNISSQVSYYARACAELDMSCAKLIEKAIETNRKNYEAETDKAPAEALYYSFMAYELGDHKTFVDLAKRAACDGNLDPENCGHAKVLALLEDKRTFVERKSEFEDLCSAGEITACHLLGYEMLATAQGDLAFPYLRKSCDPKGTAQEGCGYLGLLHLKSGQRAEALTTFEHACTLASQDIDEIACLGQAILSKDSSDPAQRLHEKCASKESPMACFLAANVAIAKENFEKPIQDVPACSSGDSTTCSAHAIASLFNLDLSQANVDLQELCESSGNPSACGAASELVAIDADVADQLEKGCERGDAKACRSLAEEKNDDGVHAESIALRFKSCDLGSVQSCRDVYQALLSAKRLFKLDNHVAATALNKFQDKACKENDQDELCLGSNSPDLSARGPDEKGE